MHQQKRSARIKRSLRIGLAATTLALGALHAAPAHAQANRPLNIIAVGDSIMWGQGLSEPHKFRNIVQAYLQSKTTSRTVTLTNFSRSGAKIESRPAGGTGALATLPKTDPALSPVMTDSSLLGEIPWQLPSITKQSSAPTLAFPDDQVDLVIMNGGADDVGLTPTRFATSILTTDFTWPTEGEHSVHAWVQHNGVDRMATYLLPETLKKYKNAIVVVVGYYPPISTDSGRSVASDFQGVWGMYGDLAAFEAASTRWATNSTLFYTVTNDGFQRAVNVANLQYGNRAIFAKLDWDPSFSYGATHTQLWKIGENDDVKSARAPVCNQAKSQMSKLDFEVCLTASVGHPNVAGAAHYASVIKAAIDPRLCAAFGLGCPFSASPSTTPAITDHESTYITTNKPAIFMPPTQGTLTGTGTFFTYTAPASVTSSTSVGLAFKPTDGTPGQSASVTVPLRVSLHLESSLDSGVTWSAGCPAHLAAGKQAKFRVRPSDGVANAAWTPLTPPDEITPYAGGIILTGVESTNIRFYAPNGPAPSTPPPSVTVRATAPDGRVGACTTGMPGVSLAFTYKDTANVSVKAGSKVTFSVANNLNNGVTDPTPDWTVAGAGRIGESAGTVSTLRNTFSGGAVGQTATVQGTTKDGTNRTFSVRVTTVAR